MGKKCMICNKEAEFKIKNSNESYCVGCAEENFGDVSLLVKVEEEAQKLKDTIKERMDI
ncbi:hypothetical protein KY306_03035 [Candidatus Woesearchaeota archaeon]|nr:hypothetical protein [Candidatus Woesearchaeota archaeon]